MGKIEKSWKEINREKKLLKKKRKQEVLLKNIEKAEKLEKLSKSLEKESKEERKLPSTVSIAVPGSILENAQTPHLMSYLAGQIARAACIFRVDEIVVFDDVSATGLKERQAVSLDEDGRTEVLRGSSLQLARILQYLECPQYLRKFFFPLHKDLKFSGLLNPLDAPHHLRADNVFVYREGITIDKKVKKNKGSYVNVGLLNEVQIDKNLDAGIRVTVKLNNLNETNTKKLTGKVVSPSEPRQFTGIYWGYSVRLAHTLSEVFTKCPYEGGYDLTIGTSDKGKRIENIERKSLKYNHVLLVFGGLKGLEAAVETDDKLTIDDPELLFDHYLNVVPNQGSRTIRTEEAILIALSSLKASLSPEVPDVEFNYKECIAQSEDTGLKRGHSTHSSFHMNQEDDELPTIYQDDVNMSRFD